MGKLSSCRLLLYLSLLLALSGIMGHVAGDVICVAQGIEMSMACDTTGSDTYGVSSITSGSTLHSGFALPALVMWKSWQILVFLLLAVRLHPALFSLSPSPPPPRRIS